MVIDWLLRITGSSPAPSYEVCGSNREKFSLPVPLLFYEWWMFVKKDPNRKNIYSTHYQRKGAEKIIFAQCFQFFVKGDSNRKNINFSLRKLKATHYQQKHAARIIFNEDILMHSRHLLRPLNALNIFHIGLHPHINSMCKSKKRQTPKIFL